MKTSWVAAGICGLAFGISGVQYIQVCSYNQRLALANVIYQAEHRILKDEIRIQEQKPSYDQGYKDALIRLGGPQSPGAYQDGWDGAMIVAGEGGYANGYHAAIQQFGYQKPDTSRYLIALSEIRDEKPENKIEIKNKDIIPEKNDLKP